MGEVTEIGTKLAEPLVDIRGRTVDLTERDEHLIGMRELREWLEARPQLPFRGYGLSGQVDVGVTTKKELAAAARHFDHADKGVDSFYYFIVRHFSGGVRYRIEAARDSVCERKVVGKKMVSKPIYTEKVQIDTIEVEEDEVEWVCPPSLLSPDNDAA